MSRRDSSLLLTRFSGFVAAQMGLHFPPDRAEDLLRGVRSAAREFGFEAADECMQWLMSSRLNRSQIEILAGTLTVGETYFFRDEKTFEAFERHLLPGLTQPRPGRGPQLRFWSAACCSGEEPYSIAISLRKALPDFADWRLTILATDINPRFLRKASAGVFSEWSFRNAPAWLKENHFDRVDDKHWKVHPAIKRMVNFSHINLAEDVYPSLLNDTNAMDVIFCRNMLIYFAPEQAEKVIQNFVRCLTDGGWLVLGPSETALVRHPQLAPVNLDGVILHRKSSSGTQSAERHSPRVETAIAGDFKPTPESVFPSHSPTSQNQGSGARLEPERPEPARIPYAEALELYLSGRYAETVARLETLPSNHPAQTEAVALMARALANQGQLTEALDWCDRVIANDKLAAGAHYLRASILQEQGRAEEAMASLHRALYLDPDFILAHFALANLARSAGDSAKADKHFENALALVRRRPDDEILLESEGISARRLSEIITALREMETAT